MSLKTIIKKNLNDLFFIKEGIEEGQPDLKYYAFDWDDNIVIMPTQIMLSTEEGYEVGMSTEDFAEYRQRIGQEPFDYKGEIIVGYAEDPYRNFGVSGDKKFIVDSLLAEPGPSWSDFVECINGGSIFAIITARGHTPSVLRESIYNMIVTNHNGINAQTLINNLKEYRDLSGEVMKDDQLLIKEYLDMCKYHPVTYGEGSASNPEEGKIKALREFINYVKYQSQKLGKKVSFTNDVTNNFVPQIGFSDDDPGNIESIKSFLDKEYEDESPVKTYLTKGGEKKEV
jgi:hypothetical protein